jgi:hypothetical protein
MDFLMHFLDWCRGRRGLAVLLCGVLAGQGCAAAVQGVAPRAPLEPGDRAVLADYVQRLPPGAAVRVDRAAGRTVRGTLLKATPNTIVVQPRTRLPEAPVEIPLDDVLAVTPEADDRGRFGTAIAAGAAAGAGAALAVFFILVAVFSD